MPGVGRKTSADLTKFAQPRDLRIARIADAQHGVISLAQLVAEGLTPSAVRMRVAAGRLHRVRREAYAVGGARLGAGGRRMAAVLACGEGALLSHHAAADQIGVLRSASAALHVTVPTRSGRRRAGIVVHRSGTLARADGVVVDGIPCTSTARTLLDLAEALSAQRLAHAIEEAERLRLIDLSAIADLLRRSASRPGAPRLVSALRDYAEPPPTREKLERAAHAVFLQAGLPAPKCNTPVPTADGPLEVDFLWPDQRLIVEADSFAWHSTRQAFERDRRRDQLLGAKGWTVVRVTWRQINHDPKEVIATLGAMALH